MRFRPSLVALALAMPGFAASAFAVSGCSDKQRDEAPPPIAAPPPATVPVAPGAPTIPGQPVPVVVPGATGTIPPAVPPPAVPQPTTTATATATTKPPATATAKPPPPPGIQIPTTIPLPPGFPTTLPPIPGFPPQGAAGGGTAGSK